MLSEIFYWVMNISILGGVSGLIVMALRKIKNLPRFAVYVLWVIPLLRLWIPFGIANEYSLMNFVSRYTTKTVVISQGLPEFTMSNSLMAANSYFPIEYKTDLLAGIIHAASVIWLIVAAASILTSLLLYIFTKSEIKNSRHIKDNIYTSSSVTAPAVYGIIHPRIILPPALGKDEIEFIVLHEQVHIRRKDNLWRVIAVITACVHWFNPLVWIFLKSFLADMELACDAKVLKQLDDNQIKDYANTILAASTGKSYFTSAFGGAKTKIRIENILSYKRLTFFSILFFTALIASIVFVLITNAKA